MHIVLHCDAWWTNVLNMEQVVVCLRWVSEKIEVYKDFVGLYQVESTETEKINGVIYYWCALAFKSSCFKGAWSVLWWCFCHVWCKIRRSKDVCSWAQNSVHSLLWPCIKFSLRQYHQAMQIDVRCARHNSQDNQIDQEVTTLWCHF